MAALKVIVRRLSSIENFGSMNVLCSDKTGTLTQGTVRDRPAYFVDRREALAARTTSEGIAGSNVPIRLRSVFQRDEWQVPLSTFEADLHRQAGSRPIFHQRHRFGAG